MASAAPMRVTVVRKVVLGALDEGFDLSVGAAGVEAIHRDGDLAVVERHDAKPMLETGSIDALHAGIATRRRDLTYPNPPGVTRPRWGTRGFAPLDTAGVRTVSRPFD